MDALQKFAQERHEQIGRLSEDAELRRQSNAWMVATSQYQYTYNFTWLGIPIIQFPQDMVALQEIIWEVRPDVIVETGIAHGGSIVFHASMLQLLGGDGIVVGVDIDIRAHNRERLEKHPLAHRMRLVQGSSIDPPVVQQVHAFVRPEHRVLVVLDSNHTHDHVLEELRAYSSLVTRDSYLVVFDTSIEDAPEGMFPDRPWGKGNNPKTAVRAFLKTTSRFVVDRERESKLLITVAPEGYLRCVES